MDIVAGCSPEALSREPHKIFSDDSIRFLACVSKTLMKEKINRRHPDVINFAFWCRMSNLKALSRKLGDERRMGRGLSLHVAPTNVPVNFAFSLAFGLLAGNSNLVRVSETIREQAEIVGSAINLVLSWREHSKMRDRISIVRYPRGGDSSAVFSAISDARVIWGGNTTITEMRALPVPARCVDVCFSDRYSFCILGASLVDTADSHALDRMVAGFYNDVFMFDQNACSSPHLVVWQGAKDVVARARLRFWRRLASMIKERYEFQPIHAVEKLSLLCRTAAELDQACFEGDGDNQLRRVFLNKVPDNIDQFRGQFGLFFEASEDNLASLRAIVNDKYQTLTYYGVDAQELAMQVKELGLRGIDRIVPVGQALDIGIIWDGYDVIGMLSRIVEWH